MDQHNFLLKNGDVLEKPLKIKTDEIVHDRDLVNKEYVDEQILESVLNDINDDTTNKYVKRDGDTMTGALSFAKTPPYNGVTVFGKDSFTYNNIKKAVFFAENGGTYSDPEVVIGIEPREDNHATTKKYVDDADTVLSNQIIELEEEIDAIAPAVERGFFRSTANNSIPLDGEFMLKTLGGKTINYGDPNIVIVELSKVDDAGVTLTFADTEPGQLIQLFEEGVDDFGLYKIESIAGTDPGTTVVTFTVSFVSGIGEATIGDLARLKIFSPPEGGTADGFVLKTGDTMTGTLEMDGTAAIKTRNLDSGQNSNLEIKHNGVSKVYVGADQTAFQHHIKFAQTGKQVYAGSDSAKKGLAFYTNGVNYVGDYTADQHVATKKNVEEAIYHDITDPDTNKYVDRSGDTMTGDLEIQTPDFGEATLVLNGKRDNTTNATATIAFKSQFDTADVYSGYLTYRTTGLNATGFFRFNKNIEFSSRDLLDIGSLELVGGGAIKTDTHRQVKFRTSTTSSAGSGWVEFQRPSVDARRGFTIRGKRAPDHQDDDLLYTYAFNSDGDAIHYTGRITNDTNITTKKYVDDGIAALLARIEELENNNGTNGGSGSMTRNIRITLDSSGSSSTSISANQIRVFTAKDTKLYVNCHPVRFKPQGRINITEKDRGDLGPIWSFHITKVSDYYLNSNNEQIVELEVALEGSATTGGSYSINSGKQLYLSLVDGAWDEGATVVSTLQINTSGSSSWANSDTPVPNSGKIYRLDNSGNFTKSQYPYGAFIPVDYMKTELNIEYHSLTASSSVSYAGSTARSVVEATVNGVKGVKIWTGNSNSYNTPTIIKVTEVEMSYSPSD